MGFRSWIWRTFFILAASGFTEQQMEFFILNSQKMPKIPDDEPIWSLSSVQAPEEHDRAGQMDFISTETNEPKSSLKSKNKKGSMCWPPVGWKTAPGFDYGFLSKGSYSTDQGWNEVDMSENAHEVAAPTADMAPAEISENYIIEEDVLPETASSSHNLKIPEVSRVCKDQFHSLPAYLQSHNKPLAVPTSVAIEYYCPEYVPAKPNNMFHDT